MWSYGIRQSWSELTWSYLQVRQHGRLGLNFWSWKLKARRCMKMQQSADFIAVGSNWKSCGTAWTGISLEEGHSAIPGRLGFWTRLCSRHHWRSQSWSRWMVGLELDFGWEGWPKPRQQRLRCGHSGPFVEEMVSKYIILTFKYHDISWRYHWVMFTCTWFDPAHVSFSKRSFKMNCFLNSRWTLERSKCTSTRNTSTLAGAQAENNLQPVITYNQLRWMVATKPS